MLGLEPIGMLLLLEPSAANCACSWGVKLRLLREEARLARKETSKLEEFLTFWLVFGTTSG